MFAAKSLFVVACILIQLCHGMYEDQLGEYDWTIQNIGFVEHTIYMGKKMFVSTSDGILACLNTRSGKLEWRVVLPKEETVSALVADKTTLFSVSADSSLISAWTTYDGTHLWTQTVAVDSMETHPSTGVVDIQFLPSDTSASSTLYVLLNNCLHILNSATGDGVVDALCGDGNLLLNDVFPKDVSLDGRRVVFTHLEGVHSPATGTSTSLHLLAGCIQSVFTDEKCAHTFVLDASLQLTSITPRAAHVFAGLVGVSRYSDVYLHSTKPTGSFEASDMIYATTSPAKYSSLTDGAVEVLGVQLLSNTILSSVLSIPTGSGYNGNGTGVRSIEVVTMQKKPIIGVCSSAQCVAAVVQMIPMSSTSEDDNSDGGLQYALSIKEAASCGGASAALSFERSLHDAHTSTMVACSSLNPTDESNTCETATCSAGGVSMTIQTVTDLTYTPLSKSNEKFTHEVNVLLEDSSASLLYLKNVYVSQYTSRSSTDSAAKNTKKLDKSVGLKALVKSSTGNLLFVQQNEVRWKRQECLSRIAKNGLVIMDNLGGLSASDHGKSNRFTHLLDGDLTAVPSLHKRLEMQKEDLLFKFQSAVDSISRMPSGLAGMIYESMPPPVQETLRSMLGNMLPDIQQAGKATAGYTENTALFGFNKMAVVLTSECDVDGSEALSQVVPISCLDTLLVSGIDLVTGDLLWSFQPIITPYVLTHLQKSKKDSSAVSVSSGIHLWARLLKIRQHGRGALPSEIALLVSVATTEDLADSKLSALLSFHFVPGNGYALYVPADGKMSPNRDPTRIVFNTGHVTTAQLLTRPLLVHESDFGHAHHGLLEYLLVHTPLGCDGQDLSVSMFPPQLGVLHGLNDDKVGQEDVYVHHITAVDMATYRVNISRTTTSHNFAISPVNNNDETDTLNLFPLERTGQVRIVSGFGDGCAERIVAVKYPTPFVAINSPARVLGDDSLLLKFLNHHIAVIVTEHKKSTNRGTATATTTTTLDGDGSSNDVPSTDTNRHSSDDNSNSGDEDLDELYVTIIDTVSAQIIHRYAIIHGRGPVAVTIVENDVYVSYWNAVAQRSEVSVVSLYEGMIGKHDLGPFSASKIVPTRSSFNAPPPVALQKTYTLPRAITAMHHTSTERGITNKHLLVALNSGQLYAVDTRMMDPRRPLSPPTPSEKEEHLQQYFPHLPILPLQMLSANGTWPKIKHIVSAAALLESTALVVAYGLDVHFTRATPSKGFDMLASDFNKPLLTLIVFGMGFACFILRRIKQKKMLGQAWA